MDQGAFAEYVLTIVIGGTWLVDHIKSKRQKQEDKIQLAELVQKMNEHFDSKLEDVKEDIKEDLEEVEDRIEEKIEGLE